MHMLAEILATEPFIIADTSLNEIDLEFYLSYRNSTTPRIGRGPSLLIEPCPDAVTRADCERHGLVLVQATFGEFLAWLKGKFPTPPSVQDLIVPDIGTLFSPALAPSKVLRFFSDFELVAGAELVKSPSPSGFMYGREPDWRDIQQHFDIERSDNAHLRKFIEVGGGPDGRRLAILLDEAGTGKTTALKRLANDLARSGVPVFSIHTLSRIDVGNAIVCLSECSASCVLIIADNLAEHVEQLAEVLDAVPKSTKVIVIGAERSYRREYLKLLIGNLERIVGGLIPFSFSESEQLLEQYRRLGLVGDRGATEAPRRFATEIHHEPVAIQVCRILNDFRPLDAIVKSLWKAAPESHRLPYLTVALAQHCYPGGVRYSILQATLGPTQTAGGLMNPVPLRLAESLIHEHFVVPLNSTIADCILRHAAEFEKDLLFDAFRGLAGALAPYVNRKAVMKKSPEARLTGRLFDADKVVKPLLGPTNAEGFYISVREQWEWNSRYWEQRALLKAESDLATSIQFARHAVAIEHHSFPLTTLG